jgi:hypothetical protein
MSLLKHVVFFILLLFLPCFVKAQAIIGFQGGVNQSNFIQIEQSNLAPIGSYNSGQGGLFLKGAHHKHLNMGLELNYRRKSDLLSVFNSTSFVNANQLIGHFKLDYVSILLLPEIKYGKKIEWFLNVGVFIGCLVSSTFFGDDFSYSIYYYHNPLFNVRENPVHYFPGYEMGAVVNTGINYTYRENWHISFSLRYFRTRPMTEFQSQDFGCLLGISRTFQWSSVFKPDGYLMKASKYMEH